MDESYRRSNITNGRRNRKAIDMQEVYRMVDQGMSLTEIAKELGVSRTTLWRHHKQYQERLDEGMQPETVATGNAFSSLGELNE